MLYMTNGKQIAILDVRADFTVCDNDFYCVQLANFVNFPM